MEPWQARSRQAKTAGPALLLFLLLGCSSGGARVDLALQRTVLPGSAIPFEKYYQVHCPDELAIEVTGEHPWQGRCRVEPDGRISLPPHGTVPVEGMPPPEIAARVADFLAVRPDQVRLQVSGYRSQQIYVYGEVAGVQRAVPYQGPETVVELLQRVGGVTPGASPGDVQVVRSHVADGRPPEVFNVDLAAIVLKKQTESNIRLQPFDQVFIGQSRRCCLAQTLPPWLRPIFEQACGMKDPPLSPPNGALLSYRGKP